MGLYLVSFHALAPLLSLLSSHHWTKTNNFFFRPFFLSKISKQSKIKSLKLVAPIIESIIPIGTEEDPEDIDDDSPSRVSFNDEKKREKGGRRKLKSKKGNGEKKYREGHEA